MATYEPAGYRNARERERERVSVVLRVVGGEKEKKDP